MKKIAIIKFTAHARKKISERKISIKIIKEAVNDPMLTEDDKFDKTLTHYIKRIGSRYLRIIGRVKDGKTIYIVSAFYDRRLKRRYKNDTNKL